MRLPSSRPAAALRRPRVDIDRQISIEAQLGYQAGERDAAVTLDSNARVGPDSSLAPTDYNSVFGQDLTSLTGPVPSLAGQQQQAAVMLAEIKLAVNKLPPSERVGAKMGWVFHLDLDLKGKQTSPLRSPFHA
jgi:hypothetical protein